MIVAALWMTGTLFAAPPGDDIESLLGEYGYELIAVPAGRMQLAESLSPAWGASHGLVSVSGFWVGKTEVTQALYEKVMGVNPSLGDTPGGGLIGSKPVQNVSWGDAVTFANTLSKLEDLTPCYVASEGALGWSVAAPCDGYRLPTGVEWEYAARAGTDDSWSGTSEESDVCRYSNVLSPLLLETGMLKNTVQRDVTPVCEDGHAGAAPVGSLMPNAWGVHDMTGNVWEWVWGECASTADPCRRMRGGSYADVTSDVAKIAFAAIIAPELRGDNIGFRLVRSAPIGS